MLEHAPRSPEEEIKAKLLAFRDRMGSHSALATMDDLNEQIGFVRLQAGRAGLKLNDKQIKAILQQQSSTVDEIMKLQAVPGNPNTRLVVQMVMATTAAVILKPNIPAAGLCNFAFRQTLHGLFGEHLGLYKGVIDLAMMVAALGLSDYSVHSLSGSVITQLEETYGRAMATLAIPAAMMLYSKGPAILAAIANSETVEVAGDFFDLMYGRADDDVYEKYPDSLATMTISDMASSVTGSVGSTLSWMWNKLPSLRSQAPMRLALPDAPHASTSTDSLTHTTPPGAVGRSKASST